MQRLCLEILRQTFSLFKKHFSRAHNKYYSALQIGLDQEQFDSREITLDLERVSLTQSINLSFQRLRVPVVHPPCTWNITG